MRVPGVDIRGATHFTERLGGEKYILFIRQSVWDAYREGLLPDVWVKWHGGVPVASQAENTIIARFSGSGFDPMYEHTRRWKCGTVPQPHFLSQLDWERAVADVRLDTNKAFSVLVGCRDGAVSLVQFVPLRFCPSAELCKADRPKVIWRLFRLGLCKYDDRWEMIEAGGDCYVELRRYSREEVAKLRRRVRNALEQDRVLAVGTAKSLGLIS